MGRDLVEGTRRTARTLIARGDAEVAAVVLDLVAARSMNAMSASPAGEDLADWQLLAEDLEIALNPIDAELAARARDLARELGMSVIMMRRNPASQLAKRPTSRRVLKALLDLGGVRCALADVRERSALGPTHFANILRALTGHGFVLVEPDSQDGRSKRISITPTGRDAMSGRAPTERRYVRRVTPRPSGRPVYQPSYQEAPQHAPSGELAA